MRWPAWLYRLVPYLGRRQAEEDLHEEFRLHLELERERQRDAGVPESDALRAARRTLGNAVLIRERTRDVWGWRWLDDLARDVRHAMRGLGREPGYVSIAVVVAALAIGATTTLFSVTNHVLLRPLPWPESEQLIRLEETRGNRPGRRAQTITNGTYLAWRDRPATIEALGGWRSRGVTMRDQGNAERLEIVYATPSLFNVLRVGPHIGRLFVEEDAGRGQAGVMVLGFGLWQQRFGGRPDVLGRPVQLDERLYTIVGVMPRGFGFPDGRTQAWVPLYVPPAESGGMRLNMLVSALARLKPGVTAAQAAAEATARAQATADRGDGLTRFGSDGEVAVAAAPALEFVRRPQFSWTRIKGQSDVEGGGAWLGRGE